MPPEERALLVPSAHGYHSPVSGFALCAVTVLSLGQPSSISTALHPPSSLSPWLPAELSCSAPNEHCGRDMRVHTHQVTASPLTPQEIHSVTPALLTPQLLQGLGLSVPLKAITQSTDAIPATEACYFISFPLAFVAQMQVYSSHSIKPSAHKWQLLHRMVKLCLHGVGLLGRGRGGEDPHLGPSLSWVQRTALKE